jgi:hypothetical protein
VSNRDFSESIREAILRRSGGALADVFPFPAGRPLPDLNDYRLVVLQYSPFSSTINDDSHEKQQLVFVKRMADALSGGTSFCFLHHDEFVPRPSIGAPQSGYMDEDDAYECRRRQAGFYWLHSRSIAAFRRDQRDRPFRFRSGRSEFEAIEPWARSFNGFSAYLSGRFDEILGDETAVTTAFGLRCGRGKLVYLPFVFPTEPDRLATVVACLIHYLGDTKDQGMQTSAS